MAAKVPTTSKANVEQSAAAAATGGPAVARAEDASLLPQSGYLTAEWVKRHYSISNSTLYKWISDSRNGSGNGFPAPVRIGPRAVRFSAESLRKFEAKLTEDGQ